MNVSWFSSNVCYLFARHIQRFKIVDFIFMNSMTLSTSRSQVFISWWDWIGVWVNICREFTSIMPVYCSHHYAADYIISISLSWSITRCITKNVLLLAIILLVPHTCLVLNYSLLRCSISFHTQWIVLINAWLHFSVNAITRSVIKTRALFWNYITIYAVQ